MALLTAEAEPKAFNTLFVRLAGCAQTGIALWTRSGISSLADAAEPTYTNYYGPSWESSSKLSRCNARNRVNRTTELDTPEVGSLRGD